MQKLIDNGVTGWMLVYETTGPNSYGNKAIIMGCLTEIASFVTMNQDKRKHCCHM